MNDLPLGQVRFVDGTTRPVHGDGDRQYVVDDDGEKVFGLWILPEEDRVDTPLVIDSHIVQIFLANDKASKFVEKNRL
jgi:hypothetical protein